jgi:molybdopterin synthase sulfur carrier subunit
MIKVLLFAQFQEELGKNQVDLELGPTTVATLKNELMDRYNLLQLDQAMIAVNENYARSEDLINPGDTVAIIPPISGG